MEPQATNPAPAPAAPPAAPPAQEPTLEAVPATWPGAFGAYNYSKEAVKYNLGSYIALVVIYAFTQVAFSLLSASIELSQGVSSLLQVVIGAIVTPAIVVLLFAGMDRKKMSLGEAFSSSTGFIVKLFVQYILLYVIMMISLLALIIPFFIIMPRLVLAPYFLVRQNLGTVEALRASWDETKGSVGKVYGVLAVTLLIGALALTIIGIPFAIYFMVMYSAALTILYGYVAEKNRATEPAAAAPAAFSAPPQAPVV